jgi:predicted SAM-dependent methyltransferase
MPYYSETEKIYPQIAKYLSGKILDIGCGNHKVTPDAIGIDGRPHEDVGILTDSLTEFPPEMQGMADVVYSSHVLEHMPDDYDTLLAWTGLLKTGGYLILYLPDGRHYNNHTNLEHMRDYTHEQFVMFFRRALCGEGKNFRGENLYKFYELTEHGMDVGDDKYSFYLVAKRVG